MIAANAVPWSNVVLCVGLAGAFVTLVWVLVHSNRSLLDVESRDPAERKAPEWSYERTTTGANPSDPPRTKEAPPDPPPAPCCECDTDWAVCRHLIASKGMAGCCGPCSLGDTHQGTGRAWAPAEPALVQCGWLKTWDDPTAPPGPLYAMSDDPEDHADEVADETLIPIYRLAAADDIKAERAAAVSARVGATPAEDDQHG